MRIIEARRRTTRVAGIILTALASLATSGWGADSSISTNTTDNTTAGNNTDPLLDLFIKKGFVTQQEAEQVEAEAAGLRTNEAQMPAVPPSQWKISQAIKHVELFGDLRLRYEDRSAADPAGNSIDLQRLRYAVRVGLRGDAFDHFYYGFRLDTGANPRSPFVTLGTSANGGPYQGPFGKSNSGINIGQVYLGWRPWDWLEVTVGKMPNPLYTTPMVWSPNISPEGFAEHLKYTVGPVDFFAGFGQFLYADFNPDSASAGLGIGLPPGSSGPGNGQQTDNIFMFAWQSGFNYQITTNVSTKIAATLYNYKGLQQSFSGNAGLSPYFGDPYVGEGAYYYYAAANPNYARGASGYSPGTTFSPIPGYYSLSFPFNQVGLNHLLVLEVPFEFNFKISRLEAQVFGDFAYNLEGRQRAEDAANAYQTILANQAQINQGIATNFPAQTHDVKAYQIGVDLASAGGHGLVYGTSSHKHAWEVRTYWQHVEQYALDPNLPDTDFFEGAQNLQGVYVALAYAITGNSIVTFRYGHASRINSLLGTGGSDSGDIPQINPIKDYDIYQLDLTFRF
ncbi:MAG TPA: putative porin [Verrucomicrobiae bacterium]|nr:putative porin [Verrucomicrobiae bacterium]